MNKDLLKIAAFCLLVLLVVFLSMRQRSMERYREAKMVGQDLATIDVCLEKGADSKKVSRVLEDAWQSLRDANRSIDGAVESLQRRGVRNFLIDSHEGTYASGQNCTRKNWMIGTKSPSDKSRIIDVVEVSNAFIKTLGDPGGAVTATVIAPDAKDGEALAQKASVLSAEQWLSLIDGQGSGFAGMLMRKDATGRTSVLKSKNYKNLQIKKQSR